MGTKRKLNKKPMRRPRKKPGDRRRRENEQKKQVAAARGVPEEEVAKMTIKDIRALLKRPARLKK